MSNYIIWKTEFDEIMVEILNEGDIAEVQKEFLDEGYIIIQICVGVFDTHTFMRVKKLEEEF